MGSHRPAGAQLRLSKQSYSEMSSSLRRQGFERLKERQLGTSDNVDLVLPSDFGNDGCEVFEKGAGNAVASFTFNEESGLWVLDLKFSKKMDGRSGLLLQAFPEKEHRVHGNTYEADMVTSDDERQMIASVDDLLVFLDDFDDDDEIGKTISAQELKKQVEKISKSFPGNKMVKPFMKYVDGFFRHCEELWQGQIQRLRLDPRIQQVMDKIMDKA